MKSNRRKFFQIAGLAGTGLIKCGISSNRQSGANGSAPNLDSGRKAVEVKHAQQFNKSDYVAPRPEPVRHGIARLGVCSTMALERLPNIDGVEVVALSDKYSCPMAKAQQYLQN